MIKEWLLRRGIVISRPPGQFVVHPYKMRAAKARGLEITSVLDGGAALGDWTLEIRAIYPEARVLAVEPRSECQAKLRQLQSDLGRIEIAQTLLGPAVGQTSFYLQGDSSSTKKEFAATGTISTNVPVTTIDALVQHLAFPYPDLIKLDLQGAELDALDGASESLQRAKAVMLEVSFIDFEKGMPVMADVVSYMAERGHVVYDILGLWHRPLDGALAQGDLLFVPKDSPLRADRRYWP
jgi:FkbM family methyltransferase